MNEFLIDLGGTIFVGAWWFFLWRLFSRNGLHNEPGLRILCVRFFFASILLAAVAELTLFNWPHYLSLWTDETLGYTAQDFEIQEGEAGTGIKLKNLDREISSLHIALSSGGIHKQQIEIIYKDEESTRRHDATLYDFSSRSHYVTLLSHGKVHELGIYSDEKLGIDTVTINPVVPIKIFMLRIALMGVLLFVGCVFMNGKTRKKLKFFLFDYSFNRASRTQKYLYWGMVFSVVMLCCFTAYIDRQAQYDLKNDPHVVYPLMVDSLLSGHLYLDVEVSPELLNSSRPYDPADRVSKGIPYQSDYAYYDGRYYSYFGVIPALILFLPFKLITGQHLSASSGVFVFAALSCLAFALLWREMVCRFMRQMPFFLYCLGALSLMMCSGILWLCRHSTYETAISSAMMFSVLGFWLFLKSFADLKKIKRGFFLAALSFALAVGCRPNAVFISLLVPIFAWYGIRYMRAENPHGARNARGSYSSLLLCLAVPYALVASFLMWYNHARFGSITDFGAFHQLTGANMKALSLANPLGKLLKIVYGFQAYLFDMPDFSAHFPFVRLKLDMEAPVLIYNPNLPVYLFGAPVVGMMNFPLLWFLFTMRRVCGAIPVQHDMLRKLLPAMLAIGFIQIVVIALNAGVLMRYAMDFLWLFALSGLVCACFTYRICMANDMTLGKTVLKMIYVFCAWSVVLWLFLSFMVYPDMPTDIRMDYTHLPIFHYLHSLFSF
jgi:hypothetical protein